MTNWKDFKNWLETNVIEPEVLVVKLRLEKQIIYTNLTSNALNRFMDSLEATLDGDESCHPFPDYAPCKGFENLFNPSTCYFGKKTNKKRIGAESYQDLKKIFLDWKKDNEIILRLSEDLDKLVLENRELQEKDEINDLKTEINQLKFSLSTKNEEITWLQVQLKKSLGEEKYKNRIEINYPLKFK